MLDTEPCIVPALFPSSLPPAQTQGCGSPPQSMTVGVLAGKWHSFQSTHTDISPVLLTLGAVDRKVSAIYGGPGTQP